MGTKNSDLVANFEATPQVLNNSALLHGSMRVAQGTIVVAAGDSDDNDIVMLAPIPSNAVVPQKKGKEQIIKTKKPMNTGGDGTAYMGEAKKAKKDYDGDGKIESGTQEFLGSRDKAIKKAIAKRRGRYNEGFSAWRIDLDFNESVKK